MVFRRAICVQNRILKILVRGLLNSKLVIILKRNIAESPRINDNSNTQSNNGSTAATMKRHFDEHKYLKNELSKIELRIKHRVS